MFRATELSGFGAGGKPPFIPDSDFWDGDQLSSFTIGAGTIDRNTTNNNVRRYIYSDAFGGDYTVDMVMNGTWLTNTEQISVGWFRSADLGSFAHLDSYGLPQRSIANSQVLRSKDTVTALSLIEATTDQSNNTVGGNDTKYTFKRVGSVITLLVNDSLHDTSALTTTDDIRLLYGSYGSASDDDGMDGIQIISDTGT